MRSLVRPALILLRNHRQAFVILNLAFFGLVGFGMGYSVASPALQKELTGTIVQGFNAPPLSFARDAYLSGNVPAATLVTFLVNSIFGSLLTITAPSLFIPFAGTAIGFFRALVWGVALAPTSPELATAMVPHSLTLLLEGEGYVMAMFGVHVLWASAASGFRSGLPGLVKGYLAGLRANLAIYALVLPILAVAALYEAFELIYLVAGVR